MCCFLPVHSWHSLLPFSFFDCDFFPSCFNSEAKGPQPAKSHRSSLAKPQKAWPPLLCSLCLPFSSYVLQYVPLSLSICMSIYLLSYVSFLHVCLYWSVCLFVSFSPLFLVLFSSNTCTQTHTHTHHPLSLPDSLSQPADWFSRRGSAGLHKHMALNLPSCVCWNGISFSVLFKAFCLIFF